MSEYTFIKMVSPKFQGSSKEQPKSLNKSCQMFLIFTGEKPTSPLVSFLNHHAVNILFHLVSHVFYWTWIWHFAGHWSIISHYNFYEVIERILICSQVMRSVEEQFVGQTDGVVCSHRFKTIQYWVVWIYCIVFSKFEIIWFIVSFIC